MKKIFVILLFVCTIASTQSFAQKESFYGAKINANNSVAVSELSKMMNEKTSLNIKLKGKIKEVCKKKGCWLTMDLGNGDLMTVRFKDYDFFVPKDADGREVIIEGVANKEEIDVATQRHYAEDAKKSKEEIAKITKPKKTITFEATGVIIKG
jgi:hypothetical protein